MSMSSPYVIVLTEDEDEAEAEDRALAARVASERTEYRDRLRAQISLAYWPLLHRHHGVPPRWGWCGLFKGLVSLTSPEAVISAL